ncbi:MAG: class II aldolase/adducin family protein [Lachnospiraceae bacterium]|nr:class II aldolase/adducin family protein [Lachnospiraceae bacterium]
MAYTEQEAKNLVIEAGHKLVREGLIVRTWGNISARISDEQFVITPSGKGYEDLTPDDIVTVTIKNCEYEGDIKPSSECGIHADVYAARPDVNFVVHTHQTYASVVSILGKDIELTEEEKQFLGDRIPCAAYGMSSSPTLRRKVKKALKASKGCSSMLLRNHGVLCMGVDFDNAFEISSMMEQVCKYKYESLTDSFAVAKLMKTDENVADAEDETEALEEDINAQGYVDYGISHIVGDDITLVLDEKEYTYKITDKKPISKGLFKRNLNRIALVHSKIYENRQISNIYHVTLPNIVDVSKTAEGFKPYIDDQAQIVGETVRCVGKIGKKPHFESPAAISRGLKDNNAVLIAGQGAICTGGSEEDTEATAYVLEKGCMAAKLAMCCTDAECVPGRIAKKERTFYKESYSKLK